REHRRSWVQQSGSRPRTARASQRSEQTLPAAKPHPPALQQRSPESSKHRRDERVHQRRQARDEARSPLFEGAPGLRPKPPLSDHDVSTQTPPPARLQMPPTRLSPVESAQIPTPKSEHSAQRFPHPTRAWKSKTPQSMQALRPAS